MPLMTTRRALLAMAAGSCAGPAQAQPSPLAGIFAAWMREHGVEAGVAAMALDGRLGVIHGFGGADPRKRMPVWSLSKFVTGLAVGRLVAQGRLALEMPLAQAMPRRLARHGVAASPLARVTLAQLLSHRSGLPRDPGGEEIPGLSAALRRQRPEEITAEHLASAVFAALPVAPPGAAYNYSNANFLLAGFAVEEAAGEPHAAFAAREVLGRLGIRDAGLDENWGMLGATGGWSLSPAEYLALLLRGIRHPALVPPRVRAWMQDPAGKQVGQGDAAFYALGLRHRPVQGGINHWHFGAMRYRWPAWGLDTNAGTFAVLTAGGDAWFAAFAPHPPDAALADLDRILWGAREAEAAVRRPDLFAEFVGPARPD
jgi:CubicO group peptidase (beta-lactamase class C family)